MGKYNDVGDRIVAARKRIGMTQNTLSEITKIPQPTLSRLEKGESKRINVAYIKTICAKLNIKESDLLDLDDISNSISVKHTLERESFEMFKECIAEVHGHVKFMAADSKTTLENYPVDRLAALYYRKILQKGNQEIFHPDINFAITKLMEEPTEAEEKID